MSRVPRERVSFTTEATKFVLALLALVFIATGVVHAGSVHSKLEARLKEVPPGTLLPVIVELEEKVHPAAAAANAKPQRKERARAVVKALRDHAERTQPPVRALIAREEAEGRARNVKRFWVFNGMALAASEEAIRKLAARHDVRMVRLDATIPAPIPRPTSITVPSAEPVWNIELVRAPEVWAIAPEFTGVGIVVGSFDSGVDGTHPELAPRYRGNHAISWFDPYGQHAVPFDASGHGTHTVGTMVGGDLSGYTIGVAPGAQWIAAKAFNDDGEGTESAFHQVFEWFLAPGGDPANAPHVVNSSWGLIPELCFPEFRPDVQAFRAAGIVPVFASGNSGPDASTVLSPGNYAESFTVGATDPYDEIAFFSGQGPSQCDGAIKPNVSAPGMFILSTFPGDQYAYLDGTSMAAPHVSGAAAVVLSIAPDLTVEEVESVIVAGAVDLGPPGMDNAFGFGRLDVAESARIALESSGASIVGVTATAGSAREAGAVPGTLRVRRSGNTDAALTVTYTVSGTAIPGSDYVALPGSVELPVGVASVDIALVPIDDALGELDETVVVTLDPNPAYIRAPLRATIVVVSDELPPDLIVASLDAPAGAGAGTSITVTDTTRNQGTTATVATLTAYYLSSDSSLDAADVRLGARTVPVLAPGAASTAAVSLAIPAATAPGVYYVIAQADSDDVQLEVQEENNTAVRAMQVGPDLHVTGVTLPANAGAGMPMTIGDVTRNQGAGSAAASTTTFYLSADSSLDAGDVVLGSRAVPVLGPNASSTGSTVVTVPAGTATGFYYVFARADAGNAVAELSEANNTNYSTLRIGPDLVVASLTAPAAGGAGTTLTVTDTTRNAGSGAAAASATRYYLSLNSLLDAADIAIGSRAVPALAPGASDTATVALALPASVPAGFYYLMAVADGDGAVPEAQEGNNILMRAIEIGADLVVSSVTAPADAGAGQAITVSDSTKNQGAGAAPASTTGYYLSADWTLDAADVSLGSRAVPALAAGATHTGSATLTLPATLAAGTYYLFARADAEGIAGELYETNNTRYATVRVGPDLTVTSLTVPASGGAGAPISVTDTTRNAGSGAAPASTTRYYLSLNSAVDAADVMLGARAVPALAAGASDTATVTLTIPASVPAGAYTLLAVADGDGVVGETQETNNLAARAIQVGADLLVSNMTVPADAGAGQAITVGDTTRNQGAGTAPASTTTFYLSADWTFDAGDVALGTRAVSALASNASETGSIVVTIPAGTATGTWYVIARADAGGVVSELFEANNTMYRSVRIGPDLTMASLTAPATAGGGVAITVTDTTRNAGAGAAAATATRFYLSLNGLLDAADILLGARAVPALAAGASDTGSVTLTVPEGTPAGSYYLMALADGDAALAETQENNNLLMRAIQVGADLVVTALTAPADAGAGLALVVGETTRNQGAGTTPASTTTYYLSSDWIFDASDVALGSRPVPPLASGVADSGSVTLTLPAGTATGSYYVIARADSGAVVSEISEANNTMYRALRVGPDLSVTSLAVPSAGGAGLAINVTETTRNGGGGAAAASSTRYYLSVNGYLDAGDVPLGSRAVPALGPGESSTATVTLTLPASTATGAYLVLAVSDGDGAVAEVSETNNVTLRAISVGPDLGMWSLAAPNDSVAGATLTITDTTRNAGAGNAVASTTTFYLSTDWTLDGADVALGTRAVGALAAGASETGSTAVTLPAGLAPGLYYLFARADSANAVAEIYETNNTTFRTLRIQ